MTLIRKCISALAPLVPLLALVLAICPPPAAVHPQPDVEIDCIDDGWPELTNTEADPVE